MVPDGGYLWKAPQRPKVTSESQRCQDLGKVVRTGGDISVLPRSLTARPWKWWLEDKPASFWRNLGLFSAAKMWNFRGVVNSLGKNSQKWWKCRYLTKKSQMKTTQKAIQCLQCFAADFSSWIDSRKESMTANRFDNVQHPDLWTMSQPTRVEKCDWFQDTPPKFNIAPKKSPSQ